jgi:crotonobetainyl-CoA:carnitine CoA-transferase CaiB-like acyl-CoA transferase
MSRPLAGLQVLDCSSGTAGPQASGLLADYGAEVIWVEPPGGDRTREREPGAAAVFNRGKRSVVLDITSAEDRVRIARLAERADVFIESWRQGFADEIGLGFDQLRAKNTQLIYASISGFGAEYPNRDLPAYEGLVHAVVGTMAYQAGHRDGPIFEGLPFASTGAAQLAVIGILAALHRRFEDGHGRRVETSLFDGALAFHQMLWGESDASVASGGAAQDTRAMLSRSRYRLITRSFACGDGHYIGIHTGAVGAFSRLMEVLGLQDRIRPVQRGFDMGTPLTDEEAEILEGSIHAIFASQPRDYWAKRLMEADVCAVEHLPPTEAFDQPQTRHNGMVVQVTDPVLGETEQVAPSIRFDGQPSPTPVGAPEPGRDTGEILATLNQPAEPSPWRASVATLPTPSDRPLLDGVKVVDLGAYYAGPFSSRVLADLGADVIKLEPTAGDQLRGIERPFFAAQAGKRSLSANLKSPALRPAIEALIKWADIVHHNMRPGAAERLGLGRDQVRALNPEAIYLYAPGWGSTGPNRMRQSFAPMLSGYVGASYEVAGQYNEPMPSVGHEDPGNGLLGAVGSLMALLERRRTGVSRYCENPQLNAALGLVAHVVRTVDGQVIGAGRLDVLQMGVEALESLYQTADGWVCLVAREVEEIRGLEVMLGLEILGDDRFATAQNRTAHRDDLAELLRAAFEKRGAAEWLKAAAESRVPLVEPAGAGVVHGLMNDPEQRRIGRVAEVLHPEKGKVRELARLVRISDAKSPPHRLAPRLGEHSEAILAWLGYTSEQIARLRLQGDIAVTGGGA